MRLGVEPITWEGKTDKWPDVRIIGHTLHLALAAQHVQVSGKLHAIFVARRANEREKIIGGHFNF